MVQRDIHLAYSLSLKHGRNFHAKAYCEETKNPGLPQTHIFRYGTGIGNDADSANSACKQAIAMLLRDNPELKDSPVYYWGRQADIIVSYGELYGFGTGGRYMGVASEMI